MKNRFIISFASLFCFVATATGAPNSPNAFTCEHYLDDVSSQTAAKIEALNSADLSLIQFEIGKLVSLEREVSDVRWDSGYRQVDLSEWNGIGDWRQIAKEGSHEFLLVALKKTHSLMMKNIIDDSLLGQWRKNNISDNGVNTAYSKIEYKILSENPYLTVSLENTFGRRYFLSIAYPEFSQLKSLLLQRFVRFQMDTAKLLLQASVSERQKVSLLASLYRDLVAIHPFKDGNGRSLRQFVFRFLFNKFGLQSPIFSDHDADFVLSEENFGEKIWQGYERAKIFHLDYQRRTVKSEDVRPAFQHLVLPESNTEKGRLVSERIRALEELSKREIDFNLWENYISPLPVKFIDGFGAMTALESKDWLAKIGQYYTKDIIWRGVPIFNGRQSDNSILSYFKSLKSEMVSVRAYEVTDETSGRDDYMREGRKDLRLFNADTAHQAKIRRLLQVHSTMDEAFTESYGSSFTKDHRIALAFALGAVAVTPFSGLQDMPRLLAGQEMLKDRIILGAYRAKKDIDLIRAGRDLGFQVKYADQQEVVAIGGIEPDALAVIKKVNAYGEITFSYVRDPEDPGMILKLKGDWTPGMPVDKAQLVNTFRL